MENEMKTDREILFDALQEIVDMWEKHIHQIRLGAGSNEFEWGKRMGFQECISDLRFFIYELREKKDEK
jgi:hypothetical protein